VTDPRQHLYRVAWAAMFVFGMLTGLPGALLTLPAFVDGFNLTLADRGAFIASLFVGLFIGSAVSGPVAEAMGSRRALTASSALVAATLPLIAVAPTYGTVSLALLAVGFASAGVNTTTNALVSDAFPDQRGHRLNMLSIAVGAGGLAMPAAAGLLAGRVSWVVLVLVPTVLSGVVALVSMRLARAPASATSAPLTVASIAQLLRQPGFAAVALLVALGSGNDVTMAGWTSTYLIDRGFAPPAAAAALTSYWFGLIAGRLAFSRFVERDKAAAVAGAAGGCAVMALLLVLAPIDAMLAVMPFLTGMAIATLVPTSLALAGERFPANAGMVFGIVMTGAQVGGMVLPALVGVIAERSGLRVGMALLVLNSLLIVAVALSARRPTRA
jgi:fucose permease